MTRREKFDYWIEQVKTGNIDRAGLLNFLEEIKPKPYVSMSKRSCTCGAKARNICEWFDTKSNRIFLKCDICNKKGNPGITYPEALKNWNAMVDKEEKINESEQA